MSRCSIMRMLVLLPLVLSACTHVRGTILSAHTKRPVANAEFTVGRPDMIPLNRFHADRAGHFDFYILPQDEPHLYVWDGRGDPAVSVRHLDRLEISDHMTIRMYEPNEIPGD
jgi:hypothetical protein